jgi:UDP-N-acetyl-D-glucosamine dehydrogenase
MKNSLIEKINNKEAIIGIIGLGYVGLPLMLEFCDKGFTVYGFDKDEKKVVDLNKGHSYIKHIPSERIAKHTEAKTFVAYADFSKLSVPDVLIMCVPTPLNKYREPDMSYILSTAETISTYMRKGQLITLESTTYPGTTEELLLPKLENAFISQGVSKEKLTVGKDFFLAFSPEREDPNNPNYNTNTIPKVVGGITESCLEVAKTVYDQVIVETVLVSTTRAAEATKLLENIYRSINIALVNELKMVFHKMNIDIWEVVNAAKTKPFGYHAFYPGPGLGGHCIPIDPFYLTWKAREFEMHTRFIELAGEINTHQPFYVVQRAMEVLNSLGKSLNGSKLLIMGAAYKKNVDDMRESPSLKLIEIFSEKGAKIEYYDPFIPKLPDTRKYQYNMESIELTADNIASYDLVVISTDHDDVDYKLVYKNAQLILDTRNVFGELARDAENKVHKA